MGVEVRCATMATEIDADGITVRNDDGEERIEAKTKVWAAGVQASPLAKLLASATGAETDRAGRIMVEPDCTLPGHPEVFAIGDMVSLNGLPGIAQPALQEGKYVGKVIRARLDGDKSVAPFKYFDKGSMATIGRTHAVASSGGMSFTGIVAYLMWAFIHVLYLIGWGNRFGTLYSWGRSLVVHKESSPPHHNARSGDRGDRRPRFGEIGATDRNRAAKRGDLYRGRRTRLGSAVARAGPDSGDRVEAVGAREAPLAGTKLTDGAASSCCAAEFAGQPSARQRQSRGDAGEIALRIFDLNLYCGQHFTVGEHRHRDAVISDF